MRDVVRGRDHEKRRQNANRRKQADDPLIHGGCEDFQ